MLNPLRRQDIISMLVQALLERSQSLQHIISSRRSRDSANYQELQHQHEQLLAYNHALAEENSHCLANHAQLMSQVGMHALWTVIASCKRMCSCSCSMRFHGD